MHSCQPRLAFRCIRPLLQQNNLRLLLLHKKPQTHKPTFQQNHSDLLSPTNVPGVEPPRNPQRKCKNFRIAKMATLTSSSFFTETNHLNPFLRRKQVPEVPSSQKTKYLKLLLHSKRSVSTSTLEHHRLAQMGILALESSSGVFSRA